MSFYSAKWGARKLSAAGSLTSCPLVLPQCPTRQRRPRRAPRIQVWVHPRPRPLRTLWLWSAGDDTPTGVPTATPPLTTDSTHSVSSDGTMGKVKLGLTLWLLGNPPLLYTWLHKPLPHSYLWTYFLFEETNLIKICWPSVELVQSSSVFLPPPAHPAVLFENEENESPPPDVFGRYFIWNQRFYFSKNSQKSETSQRGREWNICTWTFYFEQKQSFCRILWTELFLYPFSFFHVEHPSANTVNWVKSVQTFAIES